MKLNYSAPCRGDGRTIRSSGLFISPFKTETADVVEDSGPAPHSRGVRAAETARSTATLKGRREGERWTGTYRVRIVIRKGSRTVTICQAKGVTWSVE